MNNCFNGVCTKWLVGGVVRDLLVADENLYDVVGEAIFPIVAPEGTVDPFIVYYRDKYHRENSKMGITEDECHIVISIVDSDYDRGADIAQMVDAILNGIHAVEDCSFTFTLYDATEGYEDNKYYQQLVYTIQ